MSGRWTARLASAIVAIAVFWLAVDNGSYSLGGRAAIAVLAWWTIGLAFVLPIWPRERIPIETLIAGALLVAFTAVTGLSAAWAVSAEKAFVEFDRVAMYLGIFVVAAFVAPLRIASRWANGIGVGLAGVGLFALVSRLFPSVFDVEQTGEFLPGSETRLSYPVGYWNALAVLVSLSLPFLLRIAASGSNPLIRGLSVAPLPALAATVYLTSSRGGMIAAALAIGSFITVTPDRWSAASALAIAAVPTSVAVYLLTTRSVLVDEPVSSPAAISEARHAAMLIAALCAASGVAYALACLALPPRVHVPRVVKRGIAVASVLLVAVAVVAARPIDRMRAFSEPASELQRLDPDQATVRGHLLSESGSGRWQLWKAAWDEFRTRPLLGRGAGSYEAWWARHGTLDRYVKDAHSLYFETLGELGVLGLLLLVGALATGVVATARRCLTRADDERRTLAPFAAAFVAFAFAAGVDWMWEVTAVSAIGMTCLGFLVGPATRPLSSSGPSAPGRARRVGLVSRGGLAGVALAMIVAQAVPALAQSEIAGSQAAAADGDGVTALERARTARSIQPWASSPYLQLALAEEQYGAVPRARRMIASAVERDPSDWTLWIVSARLATRVGDITDARRSLTRARMLNPRSKLFAGSR